MEVNHLTEHKIRSVWYEVRNAGFANVEFEFVRTACLRMIRSNQRKIGDKMDELIYFYAIQEGLVHPPEDASN